MASRFLRSFVALVLGVCSLQANAIEFRGAEYEVYLGDVNGDGINDVYLKVPDIFVLLHGDISVPLFISSDEPSYLIESLDAESPLYLDPVIDESVDVGTLTIANEIASLIDVNGDGVSDLNFTSPLILYDFSLDGDALEQPLIVAADISVPALSKAAVDPVDDESDDEQYVEIIKGEHSVDNGGAFNYSIPIEIPPGVNGMKPDLAISYNSSSANGLLGWGWGLRAGTGISRCSASLARDGYRSGILNSDEYKFCLDGRRLIEVAPNEYRFEQESFTRITSIGADSKNPDSWVVWYKNGRRAFFGNGNIAKRFSISGKPRYWYLTRLEDISGNYISYDYVSGLEERSGSNASWTLLDKITYTKNDGVSLVENKVSFEYEDRPDDRVHFSGGEKTIQHKRLKNINISYGSNLIRQYFLNYQGYSDKELEEMPQVSRLISITKCANYNDEGIECLPIKKMEWNKSIDEIGFSSRDLREPWGSADFDGDGQLDAINIVRENDQWVVYVKPFGSEDVGVEWLRTSEEIWIRPELFDFNGDGLDDVVFTNTHVFYNNRSNVSFLKSTGTSFVYETWAEPIPELRDFNWQTEQNHPDRSVKQLVDINGDGLLDVLVRILEDGVHIRLNNGSEFEPWSMWYPGYSSELDHDNFKIGDFNGDGRKDFLVSSDSVVLINTGDSFEKQTNWQATNETEAWIADLNGDGLSDYIYYGPREGSICVLNAQLSNGHSFEPEKTWLRYDCPSTGGSRYATLDGGESLEKVFIYDNTVTFVDLNDDGCSDFLVGAAEHDDADKRWSKNVSYSSCDESSGFLKLFEWVRDDAVGTEYAHSYEDGFSGFYVYQISPGWRSLPAFVVNDLNFDGIPEIIDHKYQRTLNFTRRLVKSVSDFKSSEESEFKVYSVAPLYEVIANSAIYSPGSNTGEGTTRSGEGYKNLRSTMSTAPVVSRVASLGWNGFMSAYNTPVYTLADYKLVNYKYKGYLSNKQGWGSLGFASVESTEYRGGDVRRRTVKEYAQLLSDEYKFAGALLDQYEYITQGELEETLLSHVKNYWKLRTYSDDVDSLVDSSESKFDLYVSPDEPTLLVNPGYFSPHYFAYVLCSKMIQYDLLSGDEYTSITTKKSDSDDACLDQELVTVTAGSTEDTDYTQYGSLNFQEKKVEDVDGGTAYQVTEKAGVEDKVTTEQWVIGLAKTVTKKSKLLSLDPFIKRTEEYMFHDTGLLLSKTIEPNDELLRVKTTYTYNEVGTPVNNLQEWTSRLNDGLDYGSSRLYSLTETHNDGGGRTLVSKNALSQPITILTEGRFGKIVSESDLDNRLTTKEYDADGRIISEEIPGELKGVFSYRKCDSCFPYNFNAKWYVTGKNTGGSPSRIYYDARGREVGSRSVNLSGGYIYSYKKYDLAGLLTEESAPFLEGEQEYKTTYQYDALRRTTLVTYSDNTTRSIEYSGLTSTTTNREGQKKTKRVNGLGWPMLVTDNASVTVEYEYWPFGELKSTVVNDNSDTKIEMFYDSLGRKITHDDPDAGVTRYVYNSLGLLSEEIDANGTITRFGYDPLDRAIKRTDDAGTADALTHQWVFDNKLYGKGQLGSLNGYDSEGNAYQEVYEYDDLGFQTTFTAKIDGVDYLTRTHYDDFHRVKGVTYPTGFTYQNEYNAFGYLDRTTKLDGSLLWKANEMDAKGKLKEFEFGNGIVTNQTYHSNTGTIETITSSGNNFTVMSHEYDFSPLNNLNSRIDHKYGITESFCYDNMNRLKAARIGTCSSDDEDFTYDSLGNILSKDGVTDYAYNSGRPHALSKFMGSNYAYDNAGQMLSGGGRTISYTAFGKPSYMQKGDNWASFTYDANKNRIGRSDSNGRDTTYVGLGFYEINRSNDGVQHIHYIGDYAQYIVEAGVINDDYFVYLHRDHIGSIVAKTRELVSLISTTTDWQGFGAWGKRLTRDWSGAELGENYVPELDSRGFTGHEHIDGVGLIHMNGRVYDAAIGRFLTPDPLVQSPENTQSYNRYTYVFNNPLSFIDPSGFAADGDVEIVEVTGFRTPAIELRTTYNSSISVINAPGLDAANAIGGFDSTAIGLVVSLGDNGLVYNAGVIEPFRTLQSEWDLPFLLDMYFVYTHNVEALFKPKDQFGEAMNRYTGMPASRMEIEEAKNSLILLFATIPIEAANIARTVQAARAARATQAAASSEKIVVSLNSADDIINSVGSFGEAVKLINQLGLSRSDAIRVINGVARNRGDGVIPIAGSAGDTFMTGVISGTIPTIRVSKDGLVQYGKARVSQGDFMGNIPAVVDDFIPF